MAAEAGGALFVVHLLELQPVTVRGPSAILGGVVLLGLAYLNWRYVEALTRVTFGERHAKWLARSPFGNKIGGTVFLAAAGAIVVIGGIVQTAT